MDLDIILRKEVAVAFSIGNFEQAIPHLATNIVWNVIGENILEGKNAVKNNCKLTAEYFKSVQTDFRTNEILVSENKVIVIGTAEFKRDEKQLNFISACDVYEFNDESKLINIQSYCIPIKSK